MLELPVTMNNSKPDPNHVVRFTLHLVLHLWRLKLEPLPPGQLGFWLVLLAWGLGFIIALVSGGWSILTEECVGGN